jgi:uncharacterized protein YjbJ (UPF0337 family)
VAFHTTKKHFINWDRIEGAWQQVKGRIKAQRSKLTDDHLDKVAGKREELVGRIQEYYGIRNYEAERQVKDWEGRNHGVFAETAAQVQKHVGIARQKSSTTTVV